MLRWSGEDLAFRAGVSLSTIRRIEASSGVPEAQSVKSLLAIQKALEVGGVEFIGSPDDHPGVQLQQLERLDMTAGSSTSKI